MRAFLRTGPTGAPVISLYHIVPLEAAGEPHVPDFSESVHIRDPVRRALSVLLPPNRLALSLFLVNGYDYQEVADLTDVPLSTVKGRIQQARWKLTTDVIQIVEDRLKCYCHVSARWQEVVNCAWRDLSRSISSWNCSRA